jgi:tetratricopeptide (TPR) repeat protein
VTKLGLAGIGKSRLAADVTDAAERGEVVGVPPCRVLRGRCLPFEDGIALWPLAEMLKAEAGILDSDPAGTIVEKARSALGSRPDLGGTATVEVLLSSLGIATGADPLGGADRDTAERMIADAWRRFFAASAASGPVVALIEDIHWADGSLLVLLESVASRVQSPVLILCLSRPELLEAEPTWGSGLAAAVTLELPPLSLDEERMLLANLVGGSVDPALERAIVERTAGNPFFAGELVRMLIEDASIEEREGMWVAASDESTRLPDTVQAVIAARLDRLDPAAKRAIQDAAAVGPDFWDGAIAALGSGDRSRAIDALIERGLVREAESSSIEGMRELRFEHAVIQDVAYGTIPKSRRPDAHGAVLDWIERVSPGRDEEFSELLAHHASSAGDVERTARYAMLAGHRHRRVFAAEDAIRWYDRALAAIEELPGDTALLLAECALSRGEALEQLGRLVEAQADYERALATVRSAERGRGWLESNALAAVAHILWVQDRYGEAQALIPEALTVARTSGMPDIEARLLYEAGSMAWGQAEWAEARSLHRQALQVAETAGDLEGQAYARLGLTETGLLRGPLEEALEEAERSRSLWLRLGWPPMVHRGGELLGWILVLLGRLEEAEAVVDESLAGQRELGQRRDQASTLVPSMLIKFAHGELGDAVAIANDAVETASSLGAPRTELMTRLFRSLLHAELGAADRAGADLSRASEIGETIGIRLLHPAVVAARGWLHLEAGDHSSATDSFTAARTEAGASILHRAVCGWFEIRARANAGDARGLREAGKWVLESDTDPGPATEALASWALAFADVLDGQKLHAHERALEALRLAERAGDATVRWRAAAVVADTSDDAVESAGFRRTATDVIGKMADSIADAPVRERFLAQPTIAALIGAA